MSETCQFCNTDIGCTDPTHCRTRADALKCHWLPNDVRARAKEHDAQVSAALARITRLQVFRNARSLALRKRDPNWVFAMRLFGLGSTYAYAACEEMGIDPDAMTCVPPNPHP